MIEYVGGYAIALENREELNKGVEPLLLAKTFADTFPEMNVQADPLEQVATLEDQLQIGACVGNSGTSVVEACVFLATGRKVQLSRACGYYMAQREDNIRGDNGATISGFKRVAEKGICLESDWQYPTRYDNRIPAGIEAKRTFKVKATRPLTTVDEFDFWVREKKLPAHAGFLWNKYSDREVVSDYMASGGGGHATYFWLMNNEHYRMVNSWNKWLGTGQNKWSKKAIASLLRSNYTVMIGYAPDEMSFPDLEPIS